MTDLSLKQDLSSPDQSPQHPWPMVPVLQTLTVLSDGEEELMEQKMGIENSFMGASSKLPPLDPGAFNLPSVLGTPTVQKRKVGRPITSIKTMNRSFPAVEEIRSKLEAGECYVRPRASSSSSDVWALFQEVAYKDTHFFTGIVQCKSCKFLTRYHGQITGTSHMRRHHCFSVLFPNSVPATRKAKGQTPNGLANGTGLGNVDADSTTPRMLKKMKKDMSPSASMKQQIPMDYSSFTQLAMSAMNGSAAGLSHNSNLTIHPPLPKKRLKANGHFNMAQERSLMASNGSSNGSGSGNSSPYAPMNLSAGGSSSHSNSNNNQNSSSQSMLRPTGNSSSPSSSPNHAMNLNQQQQSNLNVPSSVTNNLRIQNSKQDLRERLVQFCCQELVPLNSVNGEAFRAILQSHLRLCTTQLHQQLAQQQQQHPQLMSLTSMVSSFMNHLSHQMPDADQLSAYLKMLYTQCRDKIRQDLSRSLETNVGGALVCDSEADTCILSAYYIDPEWRLVEAVLGASAIVYDINQFVSSALLTYSLQDSKKLSKFTFVSHGGLFDGVSLCLSSMAHIVDKVVEEAVVSADELFQSKKLPLLSDLFDGCVDLAARCHLTVPEPFTSDVEWITKFETAKVVLQHRDQLAQEDESAALNYELIAELMELLEPFRTASYELRQCFKHPTLSHVLLYFYKLKKVLASSSSYASLLRLQTEPTNLSKKKSNAAKAMNGTISTPSPPMPPKKAKRARSFENSSDQSAAGSDSDSDSEEEKEIDSSKPTVDDPLELTNGKKKGTNGDSAATSKEQQQSDAEVDDELDPASRTVWLLDHFKKFLLENLNRYYEVQSLHRIATFLWPNFRFLKMLSSAEQKEVHEEVRKMLQSRVTPIKTEANGHMNGNGSSSSSSSDGGNGFPSSGGGKMNGSTKTTKSTDFDEWEVLFDYAQDEVDKYLSVQLTSCSEDHVLQWWREHSIEFPKLSQLAKWILAIPASVTTRERFKIGHNRHIDDLTLFLHCNMQNDKFDLNSLRKTHTKTKVKHSKNNPVPLSSTSLIAQSN